MSIKFFIALAALVLTIIAYIPYFRDIFRGRTTPHLFTWLIWGVTQGTATVAVLYGGGRFGSLALIIGTILVLFVFLLSFKYGSKDITNSDKLVLALSLLAIVIWWQLGNPWLAVLMVSAIDAAGYIPTLRKLFKEPWSETLSFWVIMALVDCLAIAANAQYNLLTVVYLATILVANMLVVSVCLVRRRQIKPSATS